MELFTWECDGAEWKLALRPAFLPASAAYAPHAPGYVRHSVYAFSIPSLAENSWLALDSIAKARELPRYTQTLS
jgi:hypothetical protein